MTGLAVGKDKIIEVAAIVTDKELVPFDEGFERVIHCDEDIMNGMDEWCTEHHRDVLSLSVSLSVSASLAFPFPSSRPLFLGILAIRTLCPLSSLIISSSLYLLSCPCSPALVLSVFVPP